MEPVVQQVESMRYRSFCLTPDGVVCSVSWRQARAMLDEDHPLRVPGFAGCHIRLASMWTVSRNGTPVEIRRLVFGIARFTEDGFADAKRSYRSLVATNKAFSRIHPLAIETPTERDLEDEAIALEFYWQPTYDEEQAIRRAALGEKGIRRLKDDAVR